jgi:hypothetical protein
MPRHRGGGDAGCVAKFRLPRLSARLPRQISGLSQRSRNATFSSACGEPPEAFSVRCRRPTKASLRLLFEAMASGTAVLTVEHPTLSEGGGDAAFSLPPPSLEDLVKGLTSLFTDGDLAAASNRRRMAFAKLA